MSELPTGTVTLLLADVAGSTRLWDTQPEVMGAAVGRLDEFLLTAAATHHGVRPLVQGEGDSLTSRVQLAQEANRRGLENNASP